MANLKAASYPDFNSCRVPRPAVMTGTGESQGMETFHEDNTNVNDPSRGINRLKRPRPGAERDDGGSGDEDSLPHRSLGSSWAPLWANHPSFLSSPNFDQEWLISQHPAEVQKGSAGARADDTKGLKGVILDWITPRGQSLQPPLMRNVKTDRGFYHHWTGETALSHRARMVKQRDFKFNKDNVWDGLSRSALLVSGASSNEVWECSHPWDEESTNATPPCALEHEVLIQNNRTDLVTDSERFYGSVIEGFTEPLYHVQVNLLLSWWDAQIFPVYSDRSKHPERRGSVLALMTAQIMNEAAVRDKGNARTPEGPGGTKPRPELETV
ncbi:hypothetical protein BKA70DRAFT_1238701 [Coprinopsis sp. MPI-PUGE-AT-0042]|nr:hypothetical protein BKA70DRAFT_1238701 [Coprinopsis sp. MPI-PUGE-AT-0042]